MRVPSGDSPVQPGAPGDESADLGILLVHGIGEQTQGGTLTAFVEPIVDWIRDWLHTETGVGGRFAVVPTHGALRPPLLSPETPAHARVLMGAEHEGKENVEQWLFAEAWWAPQVLTPPISAFVGWLLTRGPWLMLFHFNQGWLASARVPLPLKWALAIPISGGWLVLSLLMNALLLAASLLALVPVGRVRQAVYGVLRALTGVLGDSYVLLRSPMQHVAFEEATLRAARWLRPQCRRLAVIAHSQGAAIAHRTLQRADSPNIDLLITVGAGITKLEALRYFERLRASDRVCALLAPLSLVATAALWLRARALDLQDVNLGVFAVGIVGVATLAVVWMTVRRALTHLRENSARLALPESQAAARWVDIVATHDPVPAGKLTDYFDLPQLDAYSIPVLRSRIGDHTGYWAARASFIPLVVDQLAKCADGHLLQPNTDQKARLSRAQRRLDWDLRVLRTLQLFDAAAVVLPFALAWNRVYAGVDELRSRLARAAGAAENEPAPLAFIDGALGDVERMLRWVSEVVAGEPVAWARPMVNGLAALLLMLLALLLWQRLTFGMWRAWSAARNEETLRQPVRGPTKLRDRVTATAAIFFVTGGFALILLLPFLLSAVWSLVPQWLDEASIYRSLAQLAGVLFLAVMAMALIGEWSEVAERVWRRIDVRNSLFSWPPLRDGLSALLNALITAAFVWLLATVAFPSLPGADYAPMLVGFFAMSRALVWSLDRVWQRLQAAGTGERRKAILLLLPPLLGSATVGWLLLYGARTDESLAVMATVGVMVALIAAGIALLCLALLGKRGS